MKQPKRWPIWKIAVATVACALGSAVLFWLSALADTTGGEPTTSPATRTQAMTLTTFLMMLAVAAAILSGLSVLWLAVRVREARRPAWERGKKRRR
ncbi:MAG: hypothetical protein KAY37_11440 [Phycisphaerae bacterium]|nr:hypothetical protein [Phycisphaerae bacterium]